MKEFLEDTSPRAKEENITFRKQFNDPDASNYDAQRLKSSIEAAIKWIEDKEVIGGQVDSMILNRGGSIEWINKKPCSID